MHAQILYGSRYGASRRYAEAFSQMTGIPVSDCASIPDLTGCDLVLHFGGLYAGGVAGLQATLRALPETARLVIATVGLADVRDPENVRNIRSALARQVPRQILDRAAVFHLRGAIDYGELKWKHRAMMTLLYQKAKRIPRDRQTPEVRAMLETFGSRVDFVDTGSLTPLLEVLPPQDR